MEVNHVRKAIPALLLSALIFLGCSKVPEPVLTDKDTATNEIISSQTILSDNSSSNHEILSNTTTGDQIVLSPEVERYIEKRVTGLSLSDTYYNFKGVEELTPTSLSAYIREAYSDYPFAKTNAIEDRKQGKGDRITYDQIMIILKEEFEIDKFPYEATNIKDLYLEVSPISANGLGEIISTTQNGDYINVIVMRDEYYNWYEPKFSYKVDGEYFHADWNSVTSPYIIKKHEFIFKIRENKMPMLIEGKIVKLQ